MFWGREIAGSYVPQELLRRFNRRNRVVVVGKRPMYPGYVFSPSFLVPTDKRPIRIMTQESGEPITLAPEVIQGVKAYEDELAYKVLREDLEPEFSPGDLVEVSGFFGLLAVVTRLVGTRDALVSMTSSFLGQNEIKVDTRDIKLAEIEVHDVVANG